ncbi:MAG: 23S rRNA (guanine745-N1)-methyltransferase [Oceanicoccus sp.]|jgi:23S rRNA (guanine745-N1)-methyltransferase
MKLPQSASAPTFVRCPLCKASLSPNEKTWQCENGHSFDIAKQGYTNLLPVQNKKSKAPGDDANMVSSRSRFLNQKFYQPISDKINEVLIKYFNTANIENPNILDAGCGEGYYTNQLHDALRMKNEKDAFSITGIDISKQAVVAAAKRNKSVNWFVGSSSDLPLDNNSQQCILSLFSPVPALEFDRCLSHDGLLIVASTGENHLIELRKILYDEVRKKTFNPTNAVESFFKPVHLHSFDIQQIYTVSFTIELVDSDTIKSLFAMTPHYWRVSPQRKEILDTINELAITVDIQLHLFSPSTHKEQRK